MAALTSLSDLLNRMTGGNNGNPENIWVHKNPRESGVSMTAPVALKWNSLWRNDGIPGAGATPTAAEAHTSATAGAVPFTNPGSGRQKWLVGAGLQSISSGTVVIYDRLLHSGGLSGTSADAQAVGGTLTRSTGGVGNQIWVEIYTQIGTTARTITASYTDDSGNEGAATAAVTIGGTGNREAGRLIPLPLASGDKGVRSVESVTLSGTTGTAGSFGVTIARPLVMLTCPLYGGAAWRSMIDGLAVPEIPSDACLALMIHSVSTSTPQLLIPLSTVEA